VPEPFALLKEDELHQTNKARPRRAWRRRQSRGRP